MVNRDTELPMGNISERVPREPPPLRGDVIPPPAPQKSETSMADVVLRGIEVLDKYLGGYFNNLAPQAQQQPIGRPIMTADGLTEAPITPVSNTDGESQMIAEKVSADDALELVLKLLEQRKDKTVAELIEEIKDNESWLKIALKTVL